MPRPQVSLQREGRFFLWNGVCKMGRGLCYGPFPPRSDHVHLPPVEVSRRDIRQMVAWHVDFIRLYTLPDKEFCELCVEEGLGIIQGVPWSDHVVLADHVVEEFRGNLDKIKELPGIIALLVGNEIRSDLVRWQGPENVLRWLENLIVRAKKACPQLLVGYANYPGTEALMPGNADFLGINLYLEDAEAYRKYLKRQQAFAGNKPLIVSEFGKHANDETVQAETWRWALQIAREEGVAAWSGFSFTDEWWRGGRLVEGWHFGLTQVDRRQRLAAKVFAESALEYPEAKSCTRFSVLVCTRNGVRSLESCLDALGKLNPAPWEVIVVDDGSDLPVEEIVRRHPAVKYVRQEPQGLSVARNRAAALASGDVFVYTDDDCAPPRDWLLWLGRIFADERWAAGGGPNLPPTPRNRTEALVAAAPGGPTHVLFSEEEAEHIPGCNLAVRREAFGELGGFEAIFTAAGDDVDFCWRLREAGFRIGFHAGAMVWHHRRFQKRAYFSQQMGYGKAEALLMSRHPGKFGRTGGARWKGQIYGGADAWYLRGAFIYQGVMGMAPYQLIYPQSVSQTGRFTGSSVWLAAAFFLFGLGWINRWLLLIPVVMLIVAWLPFLRYCRRVPLSAPAGGWLDRVVLFFLTVTAPLARAFWRHRGMRTLGSWSPSDPQVSDMAEAEEASRLRHPVGYDLKFWAENGADRHGLLERLMPRLVEREISAGFSSWEGEDFSVPGPGGRVSWISVTEYHGEGKTLTRVRISAPFDRWRWLRLAAWIPGPWIPFTVNWRRQVRNLARDTRVAAGVCGMLEVE